MELSLVLDTTAKETLQTQVFDQLRSKILEGQLKPGMVLPPSRILAERTNVSRNTVILAYERLADEGYIEARGTAGTFVSATLPDDLLSIAGGNGAAANGSSSAAKSVPLGFTGRPVGVMYPGRARPAFDFWVGRPAPNGFPLKAWKRILVRKIACAGYALTEYGDPAGYAELRTAIAEHLGPARGMVAHSEQVIITGGSQDGLNLFCHLFKGSDYPIYIENPCYQGAAYLFEQTNHDIVPIPVDENGLDVDRLPRNRGGIVYVTPSHQYPTGVTLSLERRMNLLKWAEATNSVIIEDDYDSDFRYDGPPLTALAGLDRSRRVLYLGTFSKSLGAGLRIGFVVVPQALCAATRNAKSQMNNGQPWLSQAVLAEFIVTGAFNRHLRKMRQLYKARRDCLRACLQKNFGEPALTGEAGGLHIVWRLPDGSPTAHDVERLAYAKGVGIYALDSGGAYDFDGSASQDWVVLGYSSMKEPEIERAIKRLADIIPTPGKITLPQGE